jgi:dipeptidyl aminopeptidase/acylaminoacyl peptidase
MRTLEIRTRGADVWIGNQTVMPNPPEPPMPRPTLSHLATLLIMAATLLPSTVMAQSAPDRPPLSLEDTISLKRVTKVTISPNGDAVAYVVAVPRRLYEDPAGPAWAELHVVSTDGESRPYFSGQVEVSDVAWSADGNALWFVAKWGDEAEYPDIYRMPLDGGGAELIHRGQSGIKSVHPSPTGDAVAFLATEPAAATDKTLAEKGFNALVYEESTKPVRVWLLDLESGEATAQELPGSVWAFDWAAGADRYAVALAPTPLIDDQYMASDIVVVQAADASVLGRLGLVGKLGSFAWSPDGSRIAWIGAEDLHDPSAGRLYAAPAGGGERRELLPEYPGHVSAFYWQEKDRIAWIGSRGLWSEQGVAALRRPRPAGEAPGSGPIIRQVDGRPGLRVAAAIADSPAHPPEVYLLRAGAEPARLTHSNALLEERALARQETVRFRARDGLELDMVLVHPPAPAPSGGAPLIMVIHGGPESHYSNGWNSSYSRPAQTLAAQGYLVAYPNYRGSTGRGVAFSKLGQHAYARPEFDDIVDAKQYLVAAGLADPQRTGITGGSYGGFASMWAASALSEHFAAAVAFVGISDHISKFGTTEIPVEMYNVHARAYPWDDWQWMLERSPIYHADKVRTPLLIMHGDKDSRVHPAQSLEMYRHVKVRTETPVRLVYYPGEGHGNRNTAAQYDYALRLERWMNHYLKGPGGAPPPYEIDHAARLPASDTGQAGGASSPIN